MLRRWGKLRIRCLEMKTSGLLPVPTVNVLMTIFFVILANNIHCYNGRSELMTKKIQNQFKYQDIIGRDRGSSTKLVPFEQYGKKIKPKSINPGTKRKIKKILNRIKPASAVQLSKKMESKPPEDTFAQLSPSNGVYKNKYAKLKARRRYMSRRKQLSEYNLGFSTNRTFNLEREVNISSLVNVVNKHSTVKPIDLSVHRNKQKIIKYTYQADTSWNPVKKLSKASLSKASPVKNRSMSHRKRRLWSHPDENQLLRLNKIRKRRIFMAERHGKKSMTAYKHMRTDSVNARAIKVNATKRLTRTRMEPGNKSTIGKVFRVEAGSPKPTTQTVNAEVGEVIAETTMLRRPEIRGRPQLDYPIYASIPETSFHCDSQRYWGMYADVDTRCQIWHYCDRYGKQHSFLCPNGTVFSQTTFICDWWFNVDCPTSQQLYVTNEVLSLLPAPPQRTFPEDFQGPVVDWYIFQRHQEKSYRKEKYIKLSSEGKQLRSIRFLETHDLPPWFSAKDKFLYIKLKELEHTSKLNSNFRQRQPVKKALSSYRYIDSH